MSNYADDLALALKLADLADGITIERFEAADLNVESKPDMTPVSDADLAVEEALRAELATARPADAVLGEEFGGEAVIEGRQWVIDPIDGTKNFVRGVPVWATLIALIDDGVPVVGLVSAPALQRRWWAGAGTGAWAGRSLAKAERLGVSSVDRLEDASLSYSSLSGWKDRGHRDDFLELTDRVWRTRAYGDFWSYCLVAEGTVDLAAEPELNLYDMAALVPIVEEAGGRFTGLDGAPGPFSGNALASNGLLHDQALELIGD